MEKELNIIFLQRQFLKHAEKWAIQSSDFYIADSIVIQNYLQKKYNINCKYIPYGSEISNLNNQELLSPYHISTKGILFINGKDGTGK